jgi:hypothetical protein
MGLRLGTDGAFGAWYGRQHFAEPNGHGVWNGLNLVSFDPLPSLKGDAEDPLAEHVRTLPTAFVTRVCTAVVPDFLRRYPALLDGPLPAPEPLGGFDIEWTWFGLPKRWRALSQGQARVAEPGPLLLRWEREWSIAALRRETLYWSSDGDGVVRIGPRTRAALEKIFGADVKGLAPEAP